MILNGFTEEARQSGVCRKEGSSLMRAAILTLSDKGARGEREDLSGPALSDWLIQQGVVVECISLIPDDFEQNV